MSDKRDLEILLSEILIDPSKEELARVDALSKFRREVRARTVLRRTASGCIFLIFAVLVLLPSKKVPSQTAFRPESTQLTPSKEVEIPAKLSDEELLRSFPPGSCFLAEVNGKTVLVFTDESTKKQLLN